MQKGDDLEDDFVIDDFVALSGEEDAGLEGGFFSDPEEANNDMSGDEDDATGDVQTPVDQSSAEAVALKKRKRREKEKEKKAKKRKLVESVDVIEHSITAQPPSALSDYLSSVQTKCFSKLSAIELDDIRIPGDRNVHSGYHNMDWTEDLGSSGGLHYQSHPNASYTTVPKIQEQWVTNTTFCDGGGITSADVTRVLKEQKLRGDKGGEVAKLFAKHFKLAEHVAYLRRTKVGAAVGTPGRIGKLLCDTDALTVSALSHIILDVTYRDSKKRSLLDIPETRDEVFKTVFGGPQVQKAIKEGKIQVVLF